MGRKLKRVALDFDWPLNEVWKGYINPDTADYSCPGCGGDGLSTYAKTRFAIWYGKSAFIPAKTFTADHPKIMALAVRNYRNVPVFGPGWEGLQFVHQIEAQRLTRHYNGAWCYHIDQGDVDALIKEKRLWDLTQDGHVPTVDEVNTWSIAGMGHDSINAGVVVKARCEREGLPYLCDRCKGEGTLGEAPEFKHTEPPAGPGYQLWETVSEGSPISPVFATAEELATHLAGPDSVDPGHTQARWLKWINGPGWSPTGAITDGKIANGPDVFQ